MQSSVSRLHCCSQVVLYSGQRRLKDLLEFLKEEMEKARKDRVLVTFLSSSIQVNAGALSPCVCVCLKSAADLKINLFHVCLQEDEDRRQFVEAARAEEAKRGDKSKDEL